MKTVITPLFIMCALSAFSCKKEAPATDYSEQFVGYYRNVVYVHAPALGPEVYEPVLDEFRISSSKPNEVEIYGLAGDACGISRLKGTASREQIVVDGIPCANNSNIQLRYQNDSLAYSYEWREGSDIKTVKGIAAKQE